MLVQHPVIKVAGEQSDPVQLSETVSERFVPAAVTFLQRYRQLEVFEKSCLGSAGNEGRRDAIMKTKTEMPVEDEQFTCAMCEGRETVSVLQS